MKKIWNFVYDFFIFFCNFFNFKNIFKFLMMWPVTSAPRGQNMPYQQKSGANDLFQIIFFFLQGYNSKFFFTGTKIKTCPNYRDIEKKEKNIK